MRGVQAGCGPPAPRVDELECGDALCMLAAAGREPEASGSCALPETPCRQLKQDALKAFCILPRTCSFCLPLGQPC